MTEPPFPEKPEESPADETELQWGSEPGRSPGEPEMSGPALATEDETITLKRTHFFSVLVVLAFVMGLGLGFVLWGRSPDGVSTAAAAEAGSGESVEQGEASTGSNLVVQAEPTAIPRYDIPLDDDPRLGPDDAEIVIVEFSDFECPYCRSFHAEVFTQLMEAYPGQIQFVYRDFPLTSIHPNAFSAAEAANCAQDQDAFWQYHDLLFGGALGLGDEAYHSYASQIGLDEELFAQCLSEGKFTDEVQADYDYAARLGIRSTPTFFINGLPVIGAQPYEIFSQIIERELAGGFN